MALLSLTMEGIGPFEKTELDFSDGQGKPYMGPHIIAGVNGSGKSTVLRAIAATVAGVDAGEPDSGFDFDWFLQRTVGRRHASGRTRWSSEAGGSDFEREIEMGPPAPRPELPGPSADDRSPRPLCAFVSERVGPRQVYLWSTAQFSELPVLTLAYAPSLSMQALTAVQRAEGKPRNQLNALAFSGTVDAPSVQAWMQNLRSSVSIAREKGMDELPYATPLADLGRALGEMLGASVEIDLVPGFDLQIVVRVNGQELNFSQLPDGARNLLGWFPDFVRRRATREWPDALKDRKPAVLLVDEIDAHLHPRWQRTILPALAQAFEGQEVQIIVTTHSPFVVSSCPGARVHVLDVDEKGHATARAPIDAPVGQSVNATMIDIFGVESRFDIHTERELNRWDELRKRQAVKRISDPELAEMKELAERLAGRSEELRLMVGTIPQMPEDVLLAWFQAQR